MKKLPRVFIGSSSEALQVAEKVKESLKDIADIRLWKDALSRPGNIIIEELQKQSASIDFAILVASKDDRVQSRSETYDVPRDNIIFEAGLFMGRLGLKRTIILCQGEIKLPRDLDGLIVLPIKDDTSLESAVKRIKEEIEIQGCYSSEVDFLRSYFTLIPPTIRVSDPYARIIEENWDKIRYMLNQLEKDSDWQNLLGVKERLREYFEYTGKYIEGIKFGYAYVKALNALQRPLEADWANIKDIGYMNILCTSHVEGRKVIEGVMERYPISPNSSISKAKAELLFYAYRYRGISYHRQEQPNFEKAEEDFEQAKKYINKFNEKDKKYNELMARILGNFGNLAETRKNFQAAYDFHCKSLELFKNLGDNEHIGSAHLHLAEVIIYGQSSVKLPLTEARNHLDKANEIFHYLGWIEGIARTAKYYAKFYEGLASNCYAQEKQSHLGTAKTYATQALYHFRNIKKEKEIGKLEGVIDYLNTQMEVKSPHES